jgi:short-subunit dehydrogenase
MAKRIVITGASKGIGAELARQLAGAGHMLVLSARHEDDIVAVARQVGGGARAVVGDMTIRTHVDRLRDEALRLMGFVDVWINNVGRGINRPVLRLSDEDVDQMIAVNVKSALYGMQAIVPHFQERGAGHLINVSSFLGRVPFVAVRSAYNAAKHALNALTANLRMELRNTHPGVRVSLVMPGVVRTEFAANARGGMVPGGGPPGQTAEEVAAVIADVIEHPVAEVYTNPASAEMARRYYQDVAAFEAQSSAASHPAGGRS